MHPPGTTSRRVQPHGEYDRKWAEQCRLLPNYFGCCYCSWPVPEGLIVCDLCLFICRGDSYLLMLIIRGVNIRSNSRSPCSIPAPHTYYTTHYQRYSTSGGANCAVGLVDDVYNTCIWTKIQLIWALETFGGKETCTFVFKRSFYVSLFMTCLVD